MAMTSFLQDETTKKEWHDRRSGHGQRGQGEMAITRSVKLAGYYR